ncbi:hypothetical protein BCR42DRAFT_429631 [Absidia repens]|uniref:Uncharacterized protein n=1 Tax=Absidia repens TaxID=90262 RepID=A0A1X2HRA4_9FUNG|nr:hypothetical protein BCR42DRAFT_429631 [Absidia repens]
MLCQKDMLSVNRTWDHTYNATRQTWIWQQSTISREKLAIIANDSVAAMIDVDDIDKILKGILDDVMKTSNTPSHLLCRGVSTSSTAISIPTQECPMNISYNYLTTLVVFIIIHSHHHQHNNNSNSNNSNQHRKEGERADDHPSESSSPSQLQIFLLCRPLFRIPSIL